MPSVFPEMPTQDRKESYILKQKRKTVYLSARNVLQTIVYAALPDTKRINLHKTDYCIDLQKVTTFISYTIKSPVILQQIGPSFPPHFLYKETKNIDIFIVYLQINMIYRCFDRTPIRYDSTAGWSVSDPQTTSWFINDNAIINIDFYYMALCFIANVMVQRMT